MRHFPTTLLLLLVAVGLAAGQVPDARQRSARDRSSQPRTVSGTASISGHVVTGDTGRPLARARVTATAPELSDGSLSTLTDPAGAYVLADLPPGTYFVTAGKSGFLSMAHGAQRPQRAGRRIVLAQGQHARDVDIRVLRGSVVTGRVYDDNGEPIVRAIVQAMRYQYVQGEPRLAANGASQSDDRGQYRIYGLAPGNYIVTAAARMEPLPDRAVRVSDPTTAQSYAPTYYPGVTSPADAVPISLGLEQEQPNIDFVLQTVATARVSGTVVGDAAAVAGAAVILAVDDPRGVSAGSTYGGRVQSDGSFTVTGVPPGRYIAIARSTMGGGAMERRGGFGPGGRAALTGVQQVSVGGEDVSGVTVPLSSGGTITGSVTFESAQGQRADVSKLRVSTVPPFALPFVGSETAAIQPDGSFTITNVVAGSHGVRVNTPPGWTLKGIFLDGRDVADQLLDVKAGQSVNGLQVVLTDRITTVTATVAGSPGDSVADGFAVAFTTDRAAWRPRSRGIQGVRPDDKGLCTFTGLPPGDYYLALVGDLEPGSWYDPVLLEELSKTATRVTAEEGETKAVTITGK